jgi:hypothetical protein
MTKVAVGCELLPGITLARPLPNTPATDHGRDLRQLMSPPALVRGDGRSCGLYHLRHAAICALLRHFCPTLPDILE